MDNSSDTVTISLWRERIVTKRDVLLIFNFLFLLVSVALLFVSITPEPTTLTASYLDTSTNFSKSDVFSAYGYVHSVIKTDLGTKTVIAPPTLSSDTSKEFSGLDMVFIFLCIISLLISLPVSFLLLVSRKGDRDFDSCQLSCILVFNLLTLPFFTAYFLINHYLGVRGSFGYYRNVEYKSGSMLVIIGFAVSFLLSSIILVIHFLVDSCRQRRAHGRSSCCCSRYACCGDKFDENIDTSQALASPESFIQRLLFDEDVQITTLFGLRLGSVILAFCAIGAHAYTSFLQAESADDSNPYTFVEKFYSLSRFSYIRACLNGKCQIFDNDSMLPRLGEAPEDYGSSLDVILCILPLISLLLTIPIIVRRFPCYNLSQRAAQVLLGLANPFDILTYLASVIIFFIRFGSFKGTVEASTSWHGPTGALWGGKMGPGLRCLLALIVVSSFRFIFGIRRCDRSIQTIGSWLSQIASPSVLHDQSYHSQIAYHDAAPNVTAPATNDLGTIPVDIQQMNQEAIPASSKTHSSALTPLLAQGEARNSTTPYYSKVVNTKWRKN